MSYVITIEDNPRSVQIARRCIRSAAKHGLLVQMFPAITPRNTDIYKMAEEEGIDINGFKEKYSRLDNCIAAFLSHYSIWKLASKASNTTTIFEHDAVVVDQLNSTIPFDKVVTLGKPSYGKYNTPSFLGTGPLTQKPYFGGAHAYRLNKDGAEELIKQAKIEARPTDVFLNVNTFPWLQEHYPWKVEVNEVFSTIQKTEGCLAKHQYGESYELI
jgi:GR25 family glycosyltransferase involved in LPS biosynthesis